MCCYQLHRAVNDEDALNGSGEDFYRAFAVAPLEEEQHRSAVQSAADADQKQLVAPPSKLTATLKAKAMATLRDLQKNPVKPRLQSTEINFVSELNTEIAGIDCSRNTTQAFVKGRQRALVTPTRGRHSLFAAILDQIHHGHQDISVREAKEVAPLTINRMAELVTVSDVAWFNLVWYGV